MVRRCIVPSPKDTQAFQDTTRGPGGPANVDEVMGGDLTFWKGGAAKELKLGALSRGAFQPHIRLTPNGTCPLWEGLQARDPLPAWSMIKSLHALQPGLISPMVLFSLIGAISHHDVRPDRPGNGPSCRHTNHPASQIFG